VIILALTLGLLSLAGSSAALAAGEGGTIRGEVRDSATGEPTPGVEVRLDEQVTRTDALGQFSLTKGAPPYRLILKGAGRESVVRTLSEVESR
jgi:hypothetical protein